MSRLKETNYFLTQYITENLDRKDRQFMTARHDQGIEWFQSLFDHCRSGQITGEFSPACLSDPQFPKLLYEHNPDMKLIVCYRNPVDVIYSGIFELSKPSSCINRWPQRA